MIRFFMAGTLPESSKGREGVRSRVGYTLAATPSFGGILPLVRGEDSGVGRLGSTVSSKERARVPNILTGMV